MRFICIGYLEEKRWAGLPSTQQEDILDKYARYYEEIKASGNFVAGYGLTDVSKGIRANAVGSQTQFSEIASDGAQLGGVFLLEAADLEDAKAIIARHPGLALGPFDIRPVDEELTKAVGA